MVIPSTSFIQYAMSDTDLIQLTDGITSVNEDVYREVHDMSVGEFEGYVRGIYVTPITDQATKFVKVMIADIMVYRLYMRRNPEGDKSGFVQKRYENTLKTLQNVREKRIVLDLPLVVVDDATIPSVGAILVGNTKTATFPRGFNSMYI